MQKFAKLFIIFTFISISPSSRAVKGGNFHIADEQEEFEKFLVVHPGQNAVIECSENQTESCWHGKNFEVNSSHKFGIFGRKLLIRSINSSDIEYYTKSRKRVSDFFSLEVFRNIKLFSFPNCRN